MRNTLFAAALLLAAATPAFSEELCYTFHLTVLPGQVQVSQAHGAGWLQGYAGGCDACWTGIGYRAIGGVPAAPTPQYDIAVKRTSYDAAAVRCLRDACTLSVGDAATYELSRGQSVEVPAETTLTLTATK